MTADGYVTGKHVSETGRRTAEADADGLIAELITSLSLARSGANRFQSASPAKAWMRLFGGEVFAQAMTAASHTVGADRMPHSMHGYFLRAGRPDMPIDYRVERDRDGESFSSRRISAYQGDALIFTMGASFHITEPGYLHQDQMPDVAPPEGLRSEEDIRRDQSAAMIDRVRDFALRRMPIELRPVTPRNFIDPAPRPAIQHFWIRPVAPVPDNMLLHRALLAYVSDMMLLSTALLPHGVHWSTTKIQNASLDHSLWIHAQPDFGDWMLYSLDSPWAGGARALCRGRIFDRTGQLIASVAQEGLLRLHQHQASGRTK